MKVGTNSVDQEPCYVDAKEDCCEFNIFPVEYGCFVVKDPDEGDDFDEKVDDCEESDIE